MLVGVRGAVESSFSRRLTRSATNAARHRGRSGRPALSVSPRAHPATRLCLTHLGVDDPRYNMIIVAVPALRLLIFERSMNWATVLDAGQISTGSPHGALQRQLLSDTLRALSSWLYEQSTRLADGYMTTATPRTSATALPLSGREREVAARIAEGLSNREIAEELVITLSTAERHVANILNKLGMRSRAQVAVWAVEHGLSASSFSAARSNVCTEFAPDRACNKPEPSVSASAIH